MTVTKLWFQTAAYHNATAQIVARKGEKRTEDELAADLRAILATQGAELAFVACWAHAALEARAS